ncbi:hypothetical protein PIB30_048771 [Stylosanthes scabra]|uniref:Uncharacterized protein n=1 Tax=Stylosanthes scabra TaxID=79078 RepID=A0ABU6TJ27_9FABA|nr:hypothetical protein [Stylosanthes scabra]
MYVPIVEQPVIKRGVSLSHQDMYVNCCDDLGLYAQTSTQNASQGGSKGRKKLPTRCAMKSFSQPLSNLPIGEGIETCYQEGQPHNPNLQQEQQRPMNHKKQEACPSQSSLMHLRHPTKGNGPSPPIMPPMKSLTQPSSKTKPMPKPTERAS